MILIKTAINANLYRVVARRKVLPRLYLNININKYANKISNSSNNM